MQVSTPLGLKLHNVPEGAYYKLMRRLKEVLGLECEMMVDFTKPVEKWGTSYWVMSWGDRRSRSAESVYWVGAAGAGDSGPNREWTYFISDAAKYCDAELDELAAQAYALNVAHSEGDCWVRIVRVENMPLPVNCKPLEF